MKRQEYLLALQQETQERGKTPVYLDETGFSETAFRRYAYATRGVCVEAKVPSHRKQYQSKNASDFLIDTQPKSVTL